MFIVETVYDHAARRIRVHALPGQRALDWEGHEVDVNPELWVQFPRALRTAEGLQFACETLVLVAGGERRRAYYHAGGDIAPLERVGLGDYARGAGAVTHVHVPAGGYELRPVRRLFHAGSDRLPNADMAALELRLLGLLARTASTSAIYGGGTAGGVDAGGVNAAGVDAAGVGRADRPVRRLCFVPPDGGDQRNKR